MLIEVLGSKYCAACNELRRRLNKEKIEHVFHDAFDPTPRSNDLVGIGIDEGYEAHPLVFIDGECIGEGTAMFFRIKEKLDE